MIKSELIDKRSICHALLYSNRNPDIVIPIKGIVEDIHFNDEIPYYSIKLIKFYDNINFLKAHFIDQPFLLRYGDKQRTFNIPKVNNIIELENWFIDECKHRFCVESNFVTKTKIEMTELFNKIQEYILIKNFRAIKESTYRGLYEGPLKISSFVEFNQRFKRAYNDKFNDDDADEFLSYI